MFVKNDKQHRWVNGTIGKIINIEPGLVTVEVQKRGIPHIYGVEHTIWESSKYKYDTFQKKIKQKKLGEYIQYPLTLAWSVTIHKSQGKTLEHVVLDTDSGCFACGQLYVALSRATSLEGIELKQPLKHRDLVCDQKIVRFYKMLRGEG